MTTPTVPEMLLELANVLSHAQAIIIDLDTRLSAQPCLCRPCCEARACGVEMGAWEAI